MARQHRLAHSGIDGADYLIAATALLLEADLLTTNVRHFPMLPRPLASVLTARLASGHAERVPRRGRRWIG